LIAATWAAASALLTGCQTRSTAASETAKSGPHASISFCAANAQDCTPAASFSAGTTKDLTIRSWTIGVPAGNHTQILMILMPSGEEYPETRIGFRVPDGSKDAIPEMRTIPLGELRNEQKHLTGSWTVQVLLDGRLLSTDTFEMKP
jgi:hypothetical protein